MYLTNAVAQACSLLFAAVGFVLCASGVEAKDHDITVALHVSTQGLDLSRPADVQSFYTRLKRAAWVVCTRGDRVNLVPLDDPQNCYEKSLGTAIGSVNVPLLTSIYLATHTPQQAEAYGIHVHLQAALK